MKTRSIQIGATFFLLGFCQAPAAVLYVDLNSANPTPPYTAWSTAATDIQSAIDAANDGDKILVTNGTYMTGDSVDAADPDQNVTRVDVDKAVTLQSVNGPALTIIDGSATARCVYLSSNSFFSGFTLTNGSATDGGGAYCESNAVISNCVVAYNSAGAGAAAYGSALYDCAVFNNNSDEGADLEFGTAVNCTIVNNDDAVGDCNVTNCIIYFNGVNVDTDNFDPGSIDHCCVTPLPANGFGNFTNDPAFVNFAAHDFHLQGNSPCINSGNNSAVTLTNDLDGNPRVGGGTVDAGAFEFQSPSSVLSYAWAQQYGLPTDGSVDYADLDGTGMNNWQKWTAGLNPTNPASVLAMLPPVATNYLMGVKVSWQSVDNRIYLLQRSSALTAQPGFSTIQSNIAGQSGITSVTDTTATNSGPYFYRVGVQ